MRCKNTYNALFKGLQALNGINQGNFFLRMDSEFVCLHDVMRNQLLFLTPVDEIEKFIMKMSGLRESLFYVNNVSPMFIDKDRLKAHVDRLNKYYNI